jgi:hypothetical protein
MKPDLPFSEVISTQHIPTMSATHLITKLRLGSRISWRLTALGALCAGTLGADELIVSDLRLGLETMPTHFSYTVTDANHSASGSSDFNYGFGVGLSGIYAFPAPGRSSNFFMGAEIEGANYRYQDDGRYQSYTLRGIGGYAWAFADRWQVEAEGWLGYGGAKLNIPTNALVASIDASGHVYEYGLDAGLSYQVATHWLVNVRVGWTQSHSHMSGDGLVIDIKPSGPMGFLGLTYRFGGLPPAIQ